MNFDLADRLSDMLKAKKLGSAIELAENELKKIPVSDFHKIIGKNLYNLTGTLKEYIIEFDRQTTAELRKKQGLLKSIFSSKKPVKPAAYYCEMNGFTINNDRWFVNLFSFENYEENDWDWLSGFYDSTAKDLTITGFEEIQMAFQDVHEKDRLRESNIVKAYEVCELLVILRLQELFRETYRGQENDWSQIPMFVTAHDYDMIYKVN